MGSNMATAFWLFPHLLFRRLYIMLFSQSSWVLMSLIDIRSLSSIRYCLWRHTKHISALPHFFWFVYNLLCLPFPHHKWMGSGASGNRDLLYWCKRCSPAGSHWHRHIFCRVAVTTADSGSHSCYTFQLLLPIYGCPVARVTAAPSCWAQEWMQYSLGHVFELGIPWLPWSWLFTVCCTLREGNWYFNCENIPESWIYTSTSLKNSGLVGQFRGFFLGFYCLGWKGL